MTVYVDGARIRARIVKTGHRPDGPNRWIIEGCPFLVVTT